MTIQFEVFGYALPLWIVLRTPVPTWLVAVATFVNTVLIEVLQVRASRGSEQITVAVDAMRRACFAFSLAASCSPPQAASLPCGRLALLIAVQVHTAGELWHNAGSFGLRYELAPDHAQGRK